MDRSKGYEVGASAVGQRLGYRISPRIRCRQAVSDLGSLQISRVPVDGVWDIESLCRYAGKSIFGMPSLEGRNSEYLNSCLH